MTKVAPYTMADDDDVSETNTPSTARSTNPLQATSTTNANDDYIHSISARLDPTTNPHLPDATYFDGSNHRPDSPSNPLATYFEGIDKKGLASAQR
jgi:hypothetical protein